MEQDFDYVPYDELFRQKFDEKKKLSADVAVMSKQLADLQAFFKWVGTDEYKLWLLENRYRCAK